MIITKIKEFEAECFEALTDEKVDDIITSETLISNNSDIIIMYCVSGY